MLLTSTSKNKKERTPDPNRSSIFTLHFNGRIYIFLQEKVSDFTLVPQLFSGTQAPQQEDVFLQRIYNMSISPVLEMGAGSCSCVALLQPLKYLHVDA